MKRFLSNYRSFGISGLPCPKLQGLSLYLSPSAAFAGRIRQNQSGMTKKVNSYGSRQPDSARRENVNNRHARALPAGTAERRGFTRGQNGDGESIFLIEAPEFPSLEPNSQSFADSDF